MHPHRCTAITKRGHRCTRSALPGMTVCGMHCNRADIPKPPPYKLRRLCDPLHNSLSQRPRDRAKMLNRRAQLPPKTCPICGVHHYHKDPICSTTCAENARHAHALPQGTQLRAALGRLKG